MLRQSLWKVSSAIGSANWFFKQQVEKAWDLLFIMSIKDKFLDVNNINWIVSWAKKYPDIFRKVSNIHLGYKLLSEANDPEWILKWFDENPMLSRKLFDTEFLKEVISAKDAYAVINDYTKNK